MEPLETAQENVQRWGVQYGQMFRSDVRCKILAWNYDCVTCTSSFSARHHQNINRKFRASHHNFRLKAWSKITFRVLQTCQRRQHRATPRRVLCHEEGLSCGVSKLRCTLLLRELHGGGLQSVAQDPLPPLEGAWPIASAPESGEGCELVLYFNFWKVVTI